MLGDRLRWLRNRAQLSQSEVAEQIGMSESQVLKWENNRAEPDAKSIRKLAGLFGVTSDYILGLADNPRGYMDIDIMADEWAIFRALRDASFSNFMALVTQNLKERER